MAAVQNPSLDDPTPATGDEVRALLRSALDEPDLSVAVQAVGAVVRDYLNEGSRHGHKYNVSWPSMRQAANRGVPPAVLERSLWQAHLRLIDGLLGNQATGPDHDRLHQLTSFTIRCCEEVARVHGSAGPNPEEHERCRLLVRMLNGADEDTVDGSEAERLLGLHCADQHWAAVLWSSAPDGSTVEDLIRFALTAARSVGGARPLVAVDQSSEVWMWTRWPQPPGPAAITAACAKLRFPPGLQVCSGPVVPGVSGLRRSLLGARATRQSIGSACGTGWHHFTEASPVSLLTSDQEQAAWFVQETLGELSRNEAWCATLRETLRLYLACGRSRQQVAADMYINRNTVAYRVQKAAQLIGRPIEQDTFHLRLALELARVTGSRHGTRPA